MENAAPELTAEERDIRRKYNAVVAAVQLAGIHLVKVDASLATPCRDSPDEPLALVIHPIEAHASITVADAHWDNINCELTFAVSQRREGSAETDDAMRISAEYVVFYRIPTTVGCDVDTARRFAARNAAMNAWPFFRELALSVACRMGLPDFLVPLLRIPDQGPEPGQ